MKKQILAAAIFVSSSAFACPDLAGTWSCKDTENSTSTMTVSQEAIPNGTLYRITDDDGKTEEIHADGVARAVSMGDYSGTMTATCTSATRIEAHVDFENASYGLTGMADVAVELTTAQTLTTMSDVTYSLNGGAPQKKSMAASCSR